MGNLQNHVKVHLVDRIKRWLVVRLRSVLPQKDIADKDLWALAARMVSRMEYNEAKAAAIALENGEQPPPIPAWVAPASGEDLLVKAWLVKHFNDPPLTNDSLDAIWELWNTL
jgi:hypothetical protein